MMALIIRWDDGNYTDDAPADECDDNFHFRMM